MSQCVGNITAIKKEHFVPMSSENTDSILQLIAKGEDVNAKDKNGRTPLDWAVNWNQAETADLLRKHGGKRGYELKAEGK